MNTKIYQAIGNNICEKKCKPPKTVFELRRNHKDYTMSRF